MIGVVTRDGISVQVELARQAMFRTASSQAVTLMLGPWSHASQAAARRCAAARPGSVRVEVGLTRRAARQVRCGGNRIPAGALYSACLHNAAGWCRLSDRHAGARRNASPRIGRCRGRLLRLGRWLAISSSSIRPWVRACRLVRTWSWLAVGRRVGRLTIGGRAWRWAIRRRARQRLTISRGWCLTVGRCRSVLAIRRRTGRCLVRRLPVGRCPCSIAGSWR